MFLKQYLTCVPLITSLLSCYAHPTIHRDVEGPIVIHQFEKGSWCENLAPTADGKVLVTRVDVPELYLIDPSLPPSSNAQLLATIANASSLLGITPISSNAYAFAAGSITAPTLFSIWRLDLSTSTPKISKIADVHETQLVNGIAQLPGNVDVLLLADSFAGVIWHFNMVSGALRVAINNTALALVSSAPEPLGVNGITVHDGHVYYTNSGAETFGRVPIDAHTGAATGPFSVLASKIANDDFAIGRGIAYTASGSLNEITQVDLAMDNAVKVFSGNPNSTAVAGPTSLRFGRTYETENTLFVTTNGGSRAPVNGSIVVGGSLLAFKFRW